MEEQVRLFVEENGARSGEREPMGGADRSDDAANGLWIDRGSLVAA